MSQVSQERLHVRVLLMNQIKRIFIQLPLSWCADVAVRIERSFNNYAFMKSHNKNYQDDVFRFNYSEPSYRVLSQLRKTIQCNVESIPWHESADGIPLMEEFECDDISLTLPADYKQILTARLNDLDPDDEIPIKICLTIFKVDKNDPCYVSDANITSQIKLNTSHYTSSDTKIIPEGIDVIDIQECGISSHARSCESFILLLCDKDKLNNIASMSLYSLDPMANEKIKKEIELRRMQSSEGEFSTKYECKKCGGKETRLISMQSRGADELVTMFRQCIRCNNKIG